MTAIALAPRLDLSTVSALAQDLREKAGTDLRIDASGVTHLGGLGVQLLVCAARQWRADGRTLTITPRSEAFDESLALHGISPDALEPEETQ